jgi:membrane protease YdiL (CAAX protease family)
MAWNASWLIGWEFMHRYMLLGAAQKAAPHWGWLLVPLSETLYHLQKPPIEMLGMLALSVVLTLWCMKRGNWLLGFLVHLIIEVELLIFLMIA